MLVNLIKKIYATFSYQYTGLGEVSSTKEATDGFFRRTL